MSRLRLSVAMVTIVAFGLALGQGFASADDPSNGPSAPSSASNLPGFDARATEASEVAGRVADVAKKYPDTAAPMNIDLDGGRIVQRYDRDSKESAAFLAALKGLDSANFKVVPEPVNFTSIELEETAIALVKDESWAKEVFGVVPMDIGYTEKGLDILLPGVGSAPSLDALRRDAEKKLNLPVQLGIKSASMANDPWQSSQYDASPWSGGGRLVQTYTTTQTYCTGGFVWQKWTTSKRMGSTAEHCRWKSGLPADSAQSWRTGGVAYTSSPNVVGTRYFYNIGADTQLLQARSGTAFGPTVWVGLNDKRVVKEYRSSVPVGQVVALYGAKSGYHSTTVRGHYLREFPDGTVTTLARTNSSACQPGDSGGPWFFARSDMKIAAVGQHVGLRIGCEFVQIGTIGVALSASVLLG